MEQDNDCVAHEAVERLAAGESAPQLWGRVVRHLLAGCEFCREQVRLAGWPRRSLEVPTVSPNVVPVGSRPDAYDEAFAVARRAVEVALRRRHSITKKLLGQLIGLPWEERELRVRNQRRFASPELAEALVERSHEVRSADPAEMLRFARLAVAAAEAAAAAASRSPLLLHDARARAWGQLGNAHRICSHVRGASEAFAAAMRHLEQGSGDLELRAWLWQRRATLERFVNEFSRAISLLEEAAALYRELHDRAGEVSVLISLSLTRIEACDPAPAVPELIHCLSLLHADEADLTLRASHNLVLAYLDLGRPRDAYGLIAAAEPQIEECADEISQLRWKWQQGKVDREMGMLDAAEVRLVRVRDGFAEKNLSVHTALVTVDLVELYIQQGRVGEAIGLIGEAVSIFHALGVKRDLLAALLKVREMAHQREAATQLLREVAKMTRRGVMATRVTP